MMTRLVPLVLVACLSIGCASRPAPRSPDPEPAPSEPASPEAPPASPQTHEPSAGGSQVSLYGPDGGRRRVDVGSGLEPLAVVDRAMREHGDLGVYGDLTAGLSWAVSEFTVTIRDQGERLAVELGPRSGEGHDFTFEVVRATGELLEPIIGEVAPPPDDL